MSMLSAQCDELREVADEVSKLECTDGVSVPWMRNKLTPMLRDAADTIWELRDDLQRANAENAKLRELVQDWYELAVGGADSLTDWNHAQADLEQRMRELGIKED